jgi:hypothetical protein
MPAAGMGTGLAGSSEGADQQGYFGKMTNHDGSSYYDLAPALSVSSRSAVNTMTMSV